MNRSLLRRRRIHFRRLSAEGQTLLAMAAASLVFATDVGRTDAHVLVLAVGSLLCASVAFSRAYRLGGVRVTLDIPRRVTMGEEVGIGVTVQNDGHVVHRALRLEVPHLGPAGQLRAPPSDIDVLAPGQRRSALARARFAARGPHQLGPMRVAAVLPLGFAQGPSLATEPLQFMVVPRVARVASVSDGESRRGLVGGAAPAGRARDATELLGVRPYRPGDPVRDLHARSWARHGAPMVREYQASYLTTVGVILDTDATATAHFEATLSLAAGVIARLASGDTSVELLVMADGVASLPLGRGDRTVERALDALAAVQPGPPFAPVALAALLAPHLQRFSKVVFIALADDDGRSAVVASVRSRGVPCAVLLVGEVFHRSAGSTTVARATIDQHQAFAV